jgi:2-polyprenyl-6-methoxyphenol hydroxylase-like FAD-dependent oxidoreductase
MESGVEVREGFTVDSLLTANGRVIGIRGRTGHGQPVDEHASIVIGADGVHSFVASRVEAREYDRQPCIACGFYSYFSGVRQTDIELYLRDHCAFGLVPTSDGLCLVMVNWPTDRFTAVRSDIEAHVWQVLEQVPEAADRVREGRREERWYGTAGVPGFLRKPYGEGWALVGDAGYSRDPITAQGISDAFIDAERLVDALDAGLSGRASLADALAAHESARNERVRAMYAFTCDIARLEPPPPHMQQLFAALHGHQDATNAFLSAITGAIPLDDFMSSDNLGRIMAAVQA